MSSDSRFTNNGEINHRTKPRIYEPFPAKVRGVDTNGEAFRIETVIDNLSTGGVYLRLAQPVEQGAKLFIMIRLSTAKSDEMPAPRVAARGVVLRAEPQPDGVYGLAIAFTRHRFLES
ncbi:MAG: hypothetical protein DMG05_19935 [Acidobacteria bacterium]|nr:MAG: hypothetical protein DMG05_19935 [Acidobacteriota bacterium]